MSGVAATSSGGGRGRGADTLAAAATAAAAPAAGPGPRAALTLTALLLALLLVAPACAAPHRQKRVSDQRLAEIETLLGLNKLRGRVVTVPIAYGMVDPAKIGRRRRSEEDASASAASAAAAAAAAAEAAEEAEGEESEGESAPVAGGSAGGRRLSELIAALEARPGPALRPDWARLAMQVQ